MRSNLIRRALRGSRRDFIAAAGVAAAYNWCPSLSYAQSEGRPSEPCTEIQPFRANEIKESLGAASGPLASPANAQEFGQVPEAGPILSAPVPAAPSFQAIFADDNPTQAELESVAPQRLAMERAKLWDRSRTLRWTFIQTPPTTRSGENLGRIIEDSFEEWRSYLGMRIEKVQPSQTADIKVGFRFSGFWSLVGTDATVNSLLSQYGGQSLNIQTTVAGQQNFRAVALHEIGHALGAIHEHQSPNAKIPWSLNALRQYYGGPPNNWSDSQIRYQIVNKYSVTQVNASEFDPRSIMLYPVFAKLLDQSIPNFQSFVTGWNTALSARDISFMQAQYGVGSIPTPPRPETEKPGIAGAGGRRIGDVVALGMNEKRSDEINIDGGYREYQLNVGQNGTYTIETIDQNPATFMVLELFDSSSTTTPKFSNSLGGSRLLNARLNLELTAGSYTVRARHRHYSGRGKFTIFLHPAP
jgi:hypothetical protein